MVKQWYRELNGVSSGPFSSEELQELARSGRLSPNDLIWKEGAPEWIKASQVKGLPFASTTQARTVTPPPINLTQPSGTPPNLSSISSLAIPVIPNGTMRRVRPAWLIPCISVSVVCVVAVVAVAARNFSSADRSTKLSDAERVGQTRSKQEDSSQRSGDRSEKLQEELKEDRDSLRKQIKDLKELHDKLDQDSQDLKQQRDKLDRELKNLVGRLDFLQEWRKADFVLINPTHFSVAVQDDGNAFRVISKADGELAEATLRASRNWHIPRIGADAALTREVFQRVGAGQMIPNDLDAAIRKECWKPQQFGPHSAETKTTALELVVFRDVESYDFRMGYHIKSDLEGLEFFPLGTAAERLPWSRVQPGSARRGPVDEVLRTLSDVDFLEYCILRIAQQLGSGKKDGKPKPEARPSVMVHVDIDIPDDHKVFYEKLDKQLEEQGKQPDYVEAQGLLGIMAFLVDLGVRTSVPARRKALHEEMLRTDPNGRARHLSHYVEDEIMARMSRCGISPVSDKDQKLIAGLKGALLGATNRDATHLLLVTVKNARTTGDYHLAMRLYRENGKEVWTDEGDRVLDTGGVGSQFHVASGRPAVVYLKEAAFGNFVGQESPPVMPGIKKRAVNERFSHLVYLESPTDSPVIQYRTLFQKDVLKTPRDQFESLRVIETAADVPQEHVLRYVASRIAESTIPPAGRVVQTNGRAGVVALGKKHGLKAGDRLRVVRVRPAPANIAESGAMSGRYYGLFAQGDYFLPTQVTVVEAAERQATVTVSPTGLEDNYPENVALQENDLALAKASGTRIVAVEAPLLVWPIPLVITRLGLNTNPGVRRKFELNMTQTGTQVTELLQSALKTLGVPVVVAPNPDGRRKGTNGSPEATHRVYGSITLSPKINVEARASARPVYRLELKVSPVGSNEVIEQFEFDLKDFVAPSQGE